MINLFAHSDKAVATVSSFPEVSINWMAVVAATIAAMAIGSVWYGPLLGQMWMKIVKLNKKDAAKDWQKPMFAMLLMAFVQVLIIKHFIIFVGYFYPEMSNIAVGLMTGFLLFAGIAMPIIVSNNMFARRDNRLIYIDGGNQLVTLLAISVILAIWA